MNVIKDKNQKKRFISVFLVVCLIIGAFPVCAAQAAELKLPTGLKQIEKQAFYGDTSLDTVTVQEGTEVIGSKAFANSSVKTVTLPGSLYSIANDAFSGCENLTVNAQEGTYAYTWAVKNQYIKIQSGEAGEATKVIAADTVRAGADYMVQIIGPADSVYHSIYLVNQQTGEFQRRDLSRVTDTVSFDGYFLDPSNTYRLTVYTVTRNYGTLTPVGKTVQITGQKSSAPEIELPDTMKIKQDLWIENSLNCNIYVKTEYYSENGEKFDTYEDSFDSNNMIYISSGRFYDHSDGGTIQIKYAVQKDGFWSEWSDIHTIQVSPYNFNVNIIDFPDTIDNGQDFGFDFSFEGYVGYCSYTITPEGSDNSVSGGERQLGYESGTGSLQVSARDLDQDDYVFRMYFGESDYYADTLAYEKSFEVTGSRSAAPQITVMQDQVFEDSDTAFVTISTLGADVLAVKKEYPWGDYDDTYTTGVSGNTTSYSDWFGGTGVYQYRFAVRREGKWSAWTDAIEVLVKKRTKLSPANIHVKTPITAGEDLLFSFDEVENATHYSANLKTGYGEDYERLYSLDPATPTDLNEIPGYLLAAGFYSLEIDASADEYETSSQKKNITVTGTKPEAPNVIADESLYAGQKAIFIVETNGAEALQIKYYITDEMDTYLKNLTIPVADDQTIWEYAIPSHYGGYDFVVCFSVKKDNVWSAWMTKTYILEEPLSCNVPVIHMDDEIAAGTDFSITFDTVENAAYYNCVIYLPDGNSRWDSRSTAGRINCSATEFEPGEYRFKIWAYSNDYYAIGVNEKTFTIIGEKPVPPAVQSDKTNVQIGEQFTFTVNTDGAEVLRYRRGSYDTGSINVFENETQWTTYSSDAGKYNYQFAVKRDGIWSSWSESITINVAYAAPLNAPDYAVQSPLESGRDMVITFSEVENARNYSVYLNDLDGLISLDRYVGSDDERTVSFPGYLLGVGTYEIEVHVSDNLGRSSYSDRTVTLVASERPAAPAVNPPADESMIAGNYITFTVNSTDADMIAVRSYKPGYTNNISYDTKDVQEGQNETAWQMYYEGAPRRYSFAVRKNGIWSLWSAFIPVQSSP